MGAMQPPTINSSAKGSSQGTPLSRSPLALNNPVTGNVQGPPALAPVSAAGLPNMTVTQPQVGLLGQGGGAPGAAPSSAQMGAQAAAQGAGANAVAAMQAAQAGRPTAPTITAGGPGLLGGSPTPAGSGSSAGGTANAMSQIIKSMDPKTVSSLLSLLG